MDHDGPSKDHRVPDKRKELIIPFPMLTIMI